MGHKLFNFVIGNPPYQEDTKDTSDKPVYNQFMDAAYEVADKVELITPARFLFNAGKTSTAWNVKMLNDAHFKVLDYKQDSGAVFPGTRVTGGISITYRDETIFKEVMKVFKEIKDMEKRLHELEKLIADPKNIKDEDYHNNQVM